MATQTRNPTSDANATGTWTGTAGSRWSLVDDYPDSGNPIADGLTHGTTAGRITFGFSAFTVPAGSTGISVQVQYYDFKNGTQASAARSLIRCNDTTDRVSATHNPGNANALIAAREDNWATNPKTSAAWTVDDVNGVGTNGLTAFGLGASDASPSITFSSVRIQVTYTPPVTDRIAYVTFAEAEVPTAPRQSYVTFAELETGNAPRQARFTWAELEAPDVPATDRQAQVTWAELESPTAPRQARITWGELETPNGARQARFTWAELQVADAPRSARVTVAEFEAPNAPRSALVTWAELETPNADRIAWVMFAELQAPDVAQHSSSNGHGRGGRFGIGIGLGKRRSFR